MFETAELDQKISKEEYKKQLPELRAELLQAQFALSKTNTPVIIIISGIDAAGRGDVVNALNEWLDTRGLETIALDSLTDEECERPYYWRFGGICPRGGVLAFFLVAGMLIRLCKRPIKRWIRLHSMKLWHIFIVLKRCW
jgi:polyphosphate kinase 2 (PPK2 family)